MIYEIAYGYLNISPTDFKRYTLRQFIFKLNGKQSYDERMQREDLERTRLLAFWMLQPYSNKLKKPTDLCQFEHEKKNFKQNDIELLREAAKKWKD